MAGLSSWLSPDVMHALGWALVHALWQGVGLAALATVLMAFSRRPSLRYLVATVTLVAMLAAPTATFLALMKAATPVHAAPANPAPQLSAVLQAVPAPTALPVTLGRAPSHGRAPVMLPDSPGHLFPADFFRPDALPPNILPWLVGAWLSGVALFSLRFAGGLLFLEYWRRRPSSVVGPRILALAHELERQLGITRAIRYLECGWLQVPAAIGWIHPIVLLPVQALTGLSEGQLRAIIAHELAHIKRLDPFVNLLQVLIETLLFYHPAVWWLSRRIRAERELACDEIAISLTGDRMEYARALTLIAKSARAPTLAMAANRGPLLLRILHILEQKPSGPGQRMLAFAGSLLFLVAAMGAASALFGIPYPIPMAHAKVPVKTALLPQTGVGRIAADLNAPQVPQAAAPANAVPSDQTGGNDATAQEASAPLKTDVLANKAEKPPVPSRSETLLALDRAKKLVLSLPDLSQLLPTEMKRNEDIMFKQTAPAIVALIGLTGAVAAQTSAAPTAAAQTSAAQAATGETQAAAAPKCAEPAMAGDVMNMQQVPGTDLMTLPVQIDGTPKQFLLDISTNPDEVAQTTVADLHLPYFQKYLTQNAFGDENARMGQLNAAVIDVKSAQAESRRRNPDQDVVNVASFSIAGTTARNLQLPVANDRDMGGKTEPYDGRFTGTLFPQYDINFDFGGKKFSFFTATSCEDPSQVVYWPHQVAAVIPMTVVDGKINVPVTIQGHQINAVIDMGSNHTVMRRDIAERTLGLDSSNMTPDGDREDGMGMPIYVHTFPQMTFGGVIANNVPARIQTNSMIHPINRTPVLGSRATFTADPAQHIPDLALGMDVLHQLHIYAAFAENKLYITPAQ